MSNSKNPLEIYPLHKEILNKLFADFDNSQNYKILDAGSGRTSLYFLTNYFHKSHVTALVFPGDERKVDGISESVNNTNYKLVEKDITKFSDSTPYDIVLAHLLLGEATKFANNSFKEVLNSLFSIKTKYLIIVDIKDDKEVDYQEVSKEIEKNAKIIKTIEVDKYIGFVLLKNN